MSKNWCKLNNKGDTPVEKDTKQKDMNQKFKGGGKKMGPCYFNLKTLRRSAASSETPMDHTVCDFCGLIKNKCAASVIQCVKWKVLDGCLHLLC